MEKQLWVWVEEQLERCESSWKGGKAIGGLERAAGEVVEVEKQTEKTEKQLGA